MIVADPGVRVWMPSIRRLRAARTVLLLLSIVLLGSAMLAQTPPQPVATIGVRGVGGTSWIVTPRLDDNRQSSDVVLSMDVFTGDQPQPNYMTVTECPTGWETFGKSSSCSDTPIVLLNNAVSGSDLRLGGVTTIEAGGWASFLVEVDPATDVPNGATVTLHANVTPCAAPPASELWVIDHTRPAWEPNSLGALNQCGSLPAPMLPLGVIVYAATLVVAVVARRWEWS